MGQSGFSPRIGNTTGIFAEIANAVRGLNRDLFGDGYHPERHYMRGPGPKWHAKHDRVEIDPMTAIAIAAR